MKYEAHIEDQQAQREWEEEGCEPPTGFDPGWLGNVQDAFGAGLFESDWGTLNGRGKTDVARLTLRLVQYGHGPALRALTKREPRAFDLAPHLADYAISASSLMAELLEAFWMLSQLVGGSDELVERYADAALALLDGGASRHVVAGVSLWGAWPVVERVWNQAGIRLTGWASASMEARCWTRGSVQGIEKTISMAQHGSATQQTEQSLELQKQ